jgi:hypothetical protein
MRTPHRPTTGTLAATSALVVAGALAALYPAARRRALTWGTWPQEAATPLPGDEILPHPDLVATRGIDIAAPAAEVWPWVAQLGQGRGGFYSYDHLENLVGCDVHSADSVVADWQEVAVGDPFHLHPDVALEVAAVSPGEHLVLRGTAQPDQDGPVPYDFTWCFAVHPVGSSRSRLVVRERYTYLEPWAAGLVEAVSWVSWLMTERMLRGIRDRAEDLHLTR